MIFFFQDTTWISINMAQMTVDDMVLKVVFLLQVGTGLLANTYLLFMHSSVLFTEHKPKPTDLILSNVAMANSFVLLSKGAQQIMEDMGLVHALEGSGCQVFFYFHRVSRELSLCTTSLLSGFQAVTVSPRHGVWTGLRRWVSRHVGCSCFFCWTFNLTISTISPIEIKVFWDNSSDSSMANGIACQYVVAVSGLYAIPLSLLGALLMTLMVVASMHMVCLLHRHHHRVQHIRSCSLSLTSRTSPEMRATHSILLSVAGFLPFYFLNSIYIFYGTKLFSSYLWLQHFLKFLAACFPSLSPLVLIFQNPRTLSSCF
ncbi:vomeronasal type-1 receptor 1-like [Peromyscus californicus insignis]|uniref:vomeronasal type-1 receptor 1-like n=1 Tax=Peromyscus californicus insignis TaxID=564181 RepID=UPI0022A7AFE5|nr:vomeronasal type-1 receptor 1-like [Peromyscus californicus insignis]